MSGAEDVGRALAKKLSEEIAACCEVAAGLANSESACELQYTLGWATGLLAVVDALIKEEDV